MSTFSEQLDDINRQRKVEKILLHAAKAYHDGSILKIPIDMAIFALQLEKYKQVGTYAALQFYYYGKVNISDKPQNKIAPTLGVKSRTIYRHLKWLSHRGWIVKNEEHGWIFIKGIDHICQIEGWKYRRAGVMIEADLPKVKEFLTGAVLSSIVKSGRAAGTDRINRRSETSRWPISLNLSKKVMGVSRKTAFTYRKDAKKAGYIKMIPNMPQVTGIRVSDIKTLKQNDVKSVTVHLFGSKETIDVHPDQLRTNKGNVYAQLSNLITPMVQLRKR